MHPTLLRWISASRPTLGARLAVLAFAAVAHWAFLGSLFWADACGWRTALLAAAPNLLVLGGVALGRPNARWLRRGPGATLVAICALGLGLLFVAESIPHGVVKAACGAVFGLIGGTLCGLLGATVVVPLGRAIARWRADPSPRRALDVWATLACMATVFAVTRPFHPWDIDSYGTPPPSPRDALERALTGLDLSLCACAIVIALAVYLLDHSLRRLIARVGAGGLGEHRVVGSVAAASPGVVSLATMHDEPLAALVGAPAEAGYRASAEGVVLAMVPREATVSWRSVAMPLVAAACAIGLAVSLAS